MIRNLHLLIDPEATPQVRETRKVVVSQHIIAKQTTKYVFGWDQPLQSFYLQVHDLTLHEDDQIVAWLGATKQNAMYEVEDLVKAVKKHGGDIPYKTQVDLHGEKDNGA